MRVLKAKHIKQDGSTEDITIVGALFKSNDDLYIVYVDTEGKLDGDEAEKFEEIEKLG